MADNLQETWLPIPDTGELYEASSLGRIRSKDRVIHKINRWGQLAPLRIAGRILKPWADAGGYLVIYVCFDGHRIAVNVHRLIALAFLGNDHGRHVNHIDGDKQNNRAENLEWCTRVENMAHARALGLVHDCKPILATPKRGGAVIRFQSVSDATRAMGASRNANIISAAKGRIPSAYGYHWQYEVAA